MSPLFFSTLLILSSSPWQLGARTLAGGAAKARAERTDARRMARERRQAGARRSSIHAAPAGGAAGAGLGVPARGWRPELGLRGTGRQGLAGVRLARRRRNGRPELGLGAPAQGGGPELGSRGAARARGSTSAGRAHVARRRAAGAQAWSAARYTRSGSEAACEGACCDAMGEVLRSMRQQSTCLGGRKKRQLVGPTDGGFPRDPGLGVKGEIWRSHFRG
jgi:hypothetical protein